MFVNLSQVYSLIFGLFVDLAMSFRSALVLCFFYATLCLFDISLANENARTRK